MDPVTHLLTGACLGRAGWNRKTAYATLAATFAAEAPDLDVAWGWRGPVAALQHHRGITHTLIAAPVMATAMVGAVWLWDRWRGEKGRRGQPVRWGWLWLTALVADLSHLLLDWTNTYGLRPFYPFDRHWYAGNLVFIVEPVLLLMLALALVIPAALGLADGEIGARSRKPRGRGLAIAALCGMLLLGCWRWAEQADARQRLLAADVTATEPVRVALEPYPWNPWRWHAIMDLSDRWQTAEIDTRTGAVDSDARTNVLYKPQPDAATEAAKQTKLGQVYLDWSSWPVVRDVGPTEVAGVAVGGAGGAQLPAGQRWTTVEFSDLRFAYSYRDLRMSGSAEGRLSEQLMDSPLSGWVYMVNGNQPAGMIPAGMIPAGMILDGREQR